MKLTIYIPTFKRVELRECLNSIYPQLVEGVELIVSDNDPDGSAKYVKDEYPKAKYSRRYFNLGGDTNVLRGLCSGDGQYVWVVGDDDTLLPGSIQKVLPMLNGVDRIIQWSPNAKEVGAGFAGSMRDYICGLSDKSILVASTLITANVWRRDSMNINLGLTKVDTKYPLFWAGLHNQTVAVMQQPTITVGHIHTNVFGFFNKVIDEYVGSLFDVHGLDRLPLHEFLKWNFVNISK